MSYTVSPFFSTSLVEKLCEARKGKEVWNFKDEDFEPLRHLWREQQTGTGVGDEAYRSTLPSFQTGCGMFHALA